MIHDSQVRKCQVTRKQASISTLIIRSGDLENSMAKVGLGTKYQDLVKTRIGSIAVGKPSAKYLAIYFPFRIASTLEIVPESHGTHFPYLY